MGSEAKVTRSVGGLVSMNLLRSALGQSMNRRDRKVWVLLDEATALITREDGSTLELVVGKDALTDLASAPWLVHWLITPSSSRWINAAVFHDMAYACLSESKREADRWFRQIARADGAPAVSAWLAWAGVAFGGFGAWRKNRKRLAVEGPRWRYLDYDK